MREWRTLKKVPMGDAVQVVYQCTGCPEAHCQTLPSTFKPPSHCYDEGDNK